VEGRPAGRDLPHELGGGGAALARREQHPELAVTGDLGRLLGQVRQQRPGGAVRFGAVRLRA
jgi:hypothetical protein